MSVISCLSYNHFNKDCIYLKKTCVDPESFGRRGSDSDMTIFLMRGERIQIALKEGHHWPAIETPLKWRFADVPITAKL